MENLYLPIREPASPRLTFIETPEGPYANISENRWGEERSLEFFESLDTEKDPAFLSLTVQESVLVRDNDPSFATV